MAGKAGKARRVSYKRFDAALSLILDKRIKDRGGQKMNLASEMELHNKLIKFFESEGIEVDDPILDEDDELRRTDPGTGSKALEAERFEQEEAIRVLKESLLARGSGNYTERFTLDSREIESNGTTTHYDIVKKRYCVSVSDDEVRLFTGPETAVDFIVYPR
jgi:hypothetical protein